MFARFTMDRLLLVASSFCFLFGFAYTMYALGARVHKPSRYNFGAILLGFILQTVFLYQRGQQIGRCPLTNLFEVLVFLGWSMVFFYLVVGPAYRLSLLGFFTAPLAFLLQTAALLFPLDRPAPTRSAPDAWLEMHAALSVVAYGAFAIAGVAGVMYLAQERHLKTRHIDSVFYQLPPISALALANRRLLLIGFLLLTGGLLAGAFVEQPLGAAKLVWGIGVWLVYGGILLLQTGVWRQLSPRRVAMMSVVAFALSLGSLWSLNFIS